MITKTEFDLAQRIMDGRSYPRAKTHAFAFTGLICCGGCGAFITAEEKTMHQKNGNTYHYTYYHCSRRIKRDCTEPAVSCEELESQILNVLGKITIPTQFREWAIKQLKEEHSKEKINRDEFTQVYRWARRRGKTKEESRKTSQESYLFYPLISLLKNSRLPLSAN